jgi:dihydroorotase
MIELVIEGNAYLDGELNKCCIGIDDGKIVAIKKILKGEQHYDFGDKLILPAGIDAHVHFRDPGYKEKEDFQTGTLAAAFGGISCILDMPNTKPPVISKSQVIEKLEHLSKKAYVDFGLYSSISPKTNIPATAEVCTAFKIYLASTTGDLLFSKDELLAPAINEINKAHRIPAIHAEANDIIKKNLELNGPPKNLHEHLKVRPNESEALAISRILNIFNTLEDNKNTENTDQNIQSKDNIGKKIDKNSKVDPNKIQIQKNRIHISHVSTSEAIELIRNNNKKLSNGSNNPQKTGITCEVTPHHLLLNETFQAEQISMGKVNPPLRRAEDQRALWSALADGSINILASDHAPHTIDEKSQTFDFAPAGLPGVETMLPLIVSYVKHNRLELSRFVSAISTTPAEIFGLPKGRLAPGFDGDIIVLDFYKEAPIKVKSLHSKCCWTPYENLPAIIPILTVVRGKIIMKDNNLEADLGFGRFYN